MKRGILAAVILGMCVTVSTTRADVRLPSVFGSHMVLQRDIKVPVWGWASPGEKVAVEFAGKSVSATADRSGAWLVRLAPMAAGGPHELVVKGRNIVRLTDVMVGEVWVCSGQSNMEMRLCHVDSAAAEVAGALLRNIRLFQVTNDLDAVRVPTARAAGRSADPRPPTFSRRRRILRARTLVNSMCRWGSSTAHGAARPPKHGCAPAPGLRSRTEAHPRPLEAGARLRIAELLAYHRTTREGRRTSIMSSTPESPFFHRTPMRRSSRCRCRSRRPRPRGFTTV